MRKCNMSRILFLIILVGIITLSNAEDKRVIPLDMYLIVDGSSSFREAKTDTVSWFNTQIVDRIFLEGDKVTIWSAGDSAEIVHSDEITNSDAKNDIKGKLQSLSADGKSADFTGALKDLQTRLPGTPAGRLPVSMLVTANAGGLGSVITGNSQSMLRWSRSEKYERWQALIFAPDIGRKVSQAAQEYMNSQK